MEVFRNNRTRDGVLGRILRKSAMIRARCNINLEVKHIYGKVNILADALSRVHESKNNRCIAGLASEGWQRVEVDLHCLEVENGE